MYIIQEIQTNGNVSAVTPAVQKVDRNEADSAFYFAMGAAAVSAVPIHAVVMLDEHGNIVKSGFYEHTSPPNAE